MQQDGIVARGRVVEVGPVTYGRKHERAGEQVREGFLRVVLLLWDRVPFELTFNELSQGRQTQPFQVLSEPETIGKRVEIEFSIDRNRNFTNLRAYEVRVIEEAGVIDRDGEGVQC